MSVPVLALLLLSFLAGCGRRAPQEAPPAAGRVPIRWFVGLEFGSNFDQVAELEEVVAAFNASQEDIDLQLEVASIGGAYDLFATEIAAGNGPDIIGPISASIANGFRGQWLDLTPYLADTALETSRYDPALLAYYRSTEGQTFSLPFSVSPAALFFVPEMFEERGLAYPPQAYGEGYALDGRLRPWNWETLAEVARRLTIDTRHNSAVEPGFDRDRIVQVGFHPQGQTLLSFASFWTAAEAYAEEPQGRAVSTIPYGWQDAWRWWRDGIWSAQPYIAPVTLAESMAFGGGNVFAAGKAAMALGQAADLCCLVDVQEQGLAFQFGALPAAEDGQVSGQLSETSFYIWRGSSHSVEAFRVLEYLLTSAAPPLLDAYDAMPAAADRRDDFVARQARRYPQLTAASWNVLKQGAAYAAMPGADQYVPNRNEALDRLQRFADCLFTCETLEFDAAVRQLQEDLTAIYNK